MHESTVLSNLKKLHKIQKSKIRGEDAKNAMRLKSLWQNMLYDIRYNYISLLVEKYNFPINPAEYINKHKKALHTKSIVEVVNEEGLIRSAFNSIIKELIPTHPKDEYGSTRTLNRHFVIHCGGTNSGKTYNALEALKKSPKGVYLAPLRLLALEIFQTLNQAGVHCTLSTGEEDIVVPGATHMSSTIEKLNLDEFYDTAVIDEAQMITDIQRGNAWTRAILGVKAKEIHVCCSPDAISLLKTLIEDCKDTFEVHEYQRNTPLIVEDTQFKFPESIQPGDALVAFSKRMVLRISGILASQGYRVSVLYGNLPPETRRKQIQRFIDHETDVVVTTDVIGMGVNLPIRRVVFMELRKYDGQDFVIDWDYSSNDGHYRYKRFNGRRMLYDTEFKQIAGRAGRKNIFDEGFVNALHDKRIVKKALNNKLEDLKYAYSTPLDKYILSFPIGTLRERLVAWLQSRDEIPYIKKANIDEPLGLLEKIDDRYGDMLTMEDKYRLVFIPFDSKKEELVELWLELIDRYLEDRKPIIPKYPEKENLDNLELYYRKLDLFYSYCKTMQQPMNSEEIMNLKYYTSEKIHKILKSQMKTMKHKCKRCSKELSWDFPFNICDDCHKK
jgi:ATP-dependent RNA helicase SUPV3L1/SUV3